MVHRLEPLVQRWGWILDRSISLTLSALILISSEPQSLIKQFHFLDLLRCILVPVLIIFYSLAAKRPKQYKFSFLALIGLMFSFGGFFLFTDGNRELTSKPIKIVAYCNLLYYWGFLVWSYLRLGRNLTLFPGCRQIITDGPYELVRHPIYTAYSLIALTYALLIPDPINLFAAASICIGLKLRALAEEKLLNEDDIYRHHQPRFNIWLKSPALMLPTALLVVTVSLQSAGRLESSNLSSDEITVQFGFPITELDPTIYDDWGTMFISNHIFPRLVPDVNRPTSWSIAERYNLNCEHEYRYSEDCRRASLTLKIKSMHDCNGRSLTASVIENELRLLLRKRNWILRNAVIDRSGTEIRLTFDNFPEVKRRLKNAYFRFGFSLSKPSDSRIGVGPYCLERSMIHPANRNLGLLRAISPELSIRKISFTVSETTGSKFTLALYGTSELLTDSHRVIDTHTTLGYYLVNNPNINADELPWNTLASQEIIKNHLRNVETAYPVVKSLSNLLPRGEAGNTEQRTIQAKKIRTLNLPSFLPKCDRLAAELIAFWRKSHITADAKCMNTTALIEKIVLRKALDWDSFITPLSPASADRNAIKDQYFTLGSNEAWLASNPTSMPSFKLLALGRSFIVARRDSFCGLKSNALGLGDIMVTDLISCEDQKILAF